MTSRNPVPRRLLQAFVLAVPVVCFATAAFAETAEPGQDSSGSTINDERDDAAAANAGSGWSLDPGLRLTARGITARSTAPAEDEVVDGNAIAVVITPSLVLAKDDVTVTLRTATTRLEFEDTARTDRWQNAAQAAISYDLSDATRLTAFGERSDNILAAEFTSTDEWEFGGEVMHSLDDANRVTLGASWRERSYDDATGSSGDGIRAAGEHRGDDRAGPLPGPAPCRTRAFPRRATGSLTSWPFSE